MRIDLKFNEAEKALLIKAIRKHGKTFLPEVAKAWRVDSQIVLGEVIKEQLSGRRGSLGLNRLSGNASRAMLSRTRMGPGEVKTNFFMDENNPAKRYLPIHDASWTGSRTIRPKKAKVLRFQTKDKRWHSAREVFIPERTDIVGDIEEKFGFDAEFSVKALLKRMQRQIK